MANALKKQTTALDTLLKAYRNVPGRPQNAYTSREIQRVLNIGKDKCLAFVREQIEKGAMRVIHFEIVSIVGISQRTAGYQVVQNGER